MEYVSCPLCGFEFKKEDTLCAHGCPLGALCTLMCCPSCEYEFPEKPSGGPWLRRLFARRVPRSQELPERVRTLGELQRGARAQVLCLGRTRASRPNALAVFGLVPGAEITLVQQRPSCVVQVGETELALDSDIAREILVEPLSRS